VIISGSSENFCRVAPIFDANGNQIVVKSKTKVTYESQESKEKLSLQKLSALYKSKPSHIIYQEAYSTSAPDGDKQINYAKNVTQVDSVTWLHSLCSPILLSYSKPINDSNAHALMVL